jgi:aldose 1-epimerase
MAFTIVTTPLSSFECIRITDSTQGNSIEIITKGALLNAWHIHSGNANINIVAGNDFSQGWKQFEQNGFKSAKLSPFVCRLREGTYAHQGQSLQIEKYYLQQEAIHGIVYDVLYTIVSTDLSDTSASVLLQYDYQGSDPGYPFSYRLQIKWTLEKNNLVKVETNVTNLSTAQIPMVDGWHPYFTLGGTIDQCTLQFICKGQMEYDKQLLPTGNVMEEHRFDNGQILAGIELDNGFVLKDQANHCTLENDAYRLIVQPITNYSFLQLYIPPNRNSIAIENLSGAPDAFNNKIGLQLLKPNEKLIFETSYQCFVKS